MSNSCKGLTGSCWTVSRNLCVGLSFLLGALSCVGGVREFTVMVYNVENLFDLDGIAVYEEYSQSKKDTRFPYHAGRLLTKVKAHAEVIAKVGNGKGPDILALQELEWDHSPTRWQDVLGMLERTRKTSLDKMLRGYPAQEIRDMPAEFFLLKALEEKGIRGYHVIQPKPDPMWKKKQLAHKCVVLSRFPAKKILQHPLDQARDILEVWLDVDGQDLVLFNNHWKSGASGSATEAVRIGNARVLRKRLDHLLDDNPKTDILLVGDFNSNIDQNLRFGNRIKETALNGILGSQGNEAALLKGRADLYNLWYELPPLKRGSEVYAGEWGTLIQMMVTPGLYDNRGIQYVDQSFGVLAFPGLNTHPEHGVPLSWVNLCDGAGVSDHLPVTARFRVATGKSELPKVDAKRLGGEPDRELKRRWVDSRLRDKRNLPDASVLEAMDECERLERMGTLFRVNVPRFDASEPSVRIGKEVFEIYTANYRVRNLFRDLQEGKPATLVAELGLHRGTYQLVVKHTSWVNP